MNIKKIQDYTFAKERDTDNSPIILASKKIQNGKRKSRVMVDFRDFNNKIMENKFWGRSAAKDQMVFDTGP